jgi:hypothetical protein
VYLARCTSCCMLACHCASRTRVSSNVR